jgi:hypothetical protein
MSNDQFEEIVKFSYSIDMNILDIIITNKLLDKIIIYCDYVYFTSLTFEILLEKYNNYDLSYIINRMKILNENLINLLVKYKKIEYLMILKNKFNYILSNILLEYSLLYDFQYGIDMALLLGANYIMVLNKIMKL